MLIFSTWPINIFGSNPFVKGLTVIRSMLICSIDIMFLSFFFNSKIFQFHMSNTFAILVIYSGLTILSTTLSPKIKFRIYSQLTWTMVSKYVTNLASMVVAVTVSIDATI